MSIALQIEKMTTADRIQAMEELWEALSLDKDEISSPDWHESILNTRMQKIKSGNAKFLTIKDLKNRIG
ncbi:MAG: addiction module component CHP02574 family protein [Bacteroidetes bacterium]|nr:MAG: addiction module component CHP02574 family protein [Bacteroidota bacterium]